MQPMYDVKDAISYGFMFDIVCNEHRYTPQIGHKVMDVGAHYGFYSLYCASHGASVTAYEPDPDNYEKLENAMAVAADIHLKEPSCGIVTGNKCAIWSHDALLPLTRDHHSGTSNVVSVGASRDVVVPAISFSRALVGEWDCVKMDVEGAEFEILGTAAVSDLQRIKFLTVELHPHLISNPQAAYEKLMQNLQLVFDINAQELHEGRYCKLFCTRK